MSDTILGRKSPITFWAGVCSGSGMGDPSGRWRRSAVDSRRGPAEWGCFCAWRAGSFLAGASRRKHGSYGRGRPAGEEVQRLFRAAARFGGVDVDRQPWSATSAIASKLSSISPTIG